MLSITVERLCKTFRAKGRPDLLVLDEVGFTVEAGGFVSVLGPSGSGKSVTLHIIGGLMAADLGKVGFADREGKSHATADVRLGFVFQTPRLVPWQTVEQNLRFVLEDGVNTKADIAARILAALDLMGLADFRAYYPHQISGGMQQRVAIARALAARPDVILMDEPFSHLDEITARQMRTELVSIWRRTGTTILFVTHDMAEACYLSQKIVLLTPKPTRVFSEIPISLPYPRSFGSDDIFAAEREVLRTFETAISARLVSSPIGETVC